VSAALDRFCAAVTDDERLALGLETLRAAQREARASGQLGWEEAIYEYVIAIQSGKGLNRPL
jgi:hypothetical protein